MSKDKYPFKEIETKWQIFWEENETFKVIEDESFPKEKRAYILDMFPYPSGDGLHVGHPEGYTASDIYARYLKLKGFNVLHPIGFDSFGLPAETHAIKTGIHPLITTEKNILNFKRQLKSLGFCYDWSREIATHKPDYYKWTQWLFIQLYNKGLAYSDEIYTWFCSELNTVLANEEVLNTEFGPRSERGNHPVFKKKLRQWLLKITNYSEKLLEFDGLDWDSSIIAMQKNWIGKTEGVLIKFKIKNSNKNIEVFTTRPDTIYGVTYLVLAPENEIVNEIYKEEFRDEIDNYIKQSSLKSELQRQELQKEKTGVFIGCYALHPLTNEELPIYISDYVLINYGTGAVMAVPAHDNRDFEFAKKFKLLLKQVVTKKDQILDLNQAFTEQGYSINSFEFNGLKSKEMKKVMIKEFENKKIGKAKTNYKLRDWIFSRQRYWGEPIPILIDKENNYTVENKLPLILPDLDEYKPKNEGDPPLSNALTWVNVDKQYNRETNTMPQWAGSCWYYLRFTDPHNENEFASKKNLDYWLPVDVYVGGAEHAVLHLLYARFWHKVLYDLGYVNCKEPFVKLINQGMITSFAYKDKNGNIYLYDDVYEKDNKFFLKRNDTKVEKIITKMSKSLKNVVNPDDIVDEYGADSLRLFEMFLGPLSQSKPWDTSNIIGVYRFLEKVYKLKDIQIIEKENKNIEKLLHKTIKKVEVDTVSFSFNTAISQMMIFINELNKQKQATKQTLENFILILAPYAPHLSEEIWEYLGHKNTLTYEKYPTFKEELTTEDNYELVVQINGKLRDKIEVKKGIEKNEMENIALNQEKIKEFLKDKTVIKIICVIDKLVNIVIKNT